MSWKFNPPPGWPQQPEGWVPPPGWTPDPSWPAAPGGWQFWVAAGSSQASAPPAPVSSPSGATPTPTPSGGTAFPPAAATPSAFSPGAPAPQPAFGQPAFGQPAFGTATQPAFGPPSSAPAGDRPWFGRWWTIVVLLGMLLLGAVGGYGGTRVALDLSSDESASAAPAPGPSARESPELPTITEPPFDLPTMPPSDSPSGSVCGEVATIMIQVALASMEESDDFNAYLDGIVDARLTAAGQLRDVDTDDPQERESLDTLADELDESAELLDDNRRDIDTIDESFEVVSEAYSDFNAVHC